MRKILVIIALVAIVAMAETFKFPGWFLDAEVYDAAIARYEAAAENEKPFDNGVYERLCYAKALLGRELKSVDDFMAVIETIVPKKTKAYKASYAFMAIQTTLKMKKGSAEATALCKDTYEWYTRNSMYQAGLLLTHPEYCKVLELTDDEIARGLAASLCCETRASHTGVGNILNALYKKLSDCTIPEADQLAILKKINRIYSAELVGKDKDKWEPIIAKLRTVIAAY